jgi:hypothetical protein
MYFAVKDQRSALRRVVFLERRSFGYGELLVGDLSFFIKVLERQQVFSNSHTPSGLHYGLCLDREILCMNKYPRSKTHRFRLCRNVYLSAPVTAFAPVCRIRE